MTRPYCIIGSVNEKPFPSASSSDTLSTANPVTSTTSLLVVELVFTSLQTPSKLTTIAITNTSAVDSQVTPQPTQPRMAPNYNKFHFVSRGVSYSQINSYEKTTQADLVRWNPTVFGDCSDLQGEVNVCVGIVGTATMISPNPSTTTTARNYIQTPRPSQPGVIKHCAKLHLVAEGVTCSQIYSYDKIPLADFIR